MSCVCKGQWSKVYKCVQVFVSKCVRINQMLDWISVVSKLNGENQIEVPILLPIKNVLRLRILQNFDKIQNLKLFTILVHF